MGKVLCPQHQMHPSDCFELHYPESSTETKGLTKAELLVRANRAHIRRQEQNFAKNVVDASKRFQQSKKAAEPKAVAKPTTDSNAKEA